MLPQTFKDREVIKDIIGQRYQVSSMRGAEAFYMHELKQQEEQNMQQQQQKQPQAKSKDDFQDSINGKDMSSINDGHSEQQKLRMDANLIAAQADLKPNKSIVFPSQGYMSQPKNSAMKRQGQSYTHRRMYNNSHQLPSEYNKTNDEIMTHRQLVHKAALDRLSLSKVRVKAHIRNPDYIPKKEFGFRTINSPSKFSEINTENSLKLSKPQIREISQI